MKQILQEIGTGRTRVEDVPAPPAQRGGVQIITRRSLISAGTERMVVEFGRAGFLDKARQQPEKVRQVLGKLQTEGVLTTLEAVRSKLSQSVPLGYCNVGVVSAVGEGAEEFSVGDRVVSNGPHAQIVAVPRNLCVHIPDAVSDDAAAFTVLGSIAMQGIRLAAPSLGECFVVTGLGLIGLMAVQILRANGCTVLGIDPDPAKTALARELGASTVDLARGEDPLERAASFSRGRGVDGVLITAATQSNEPVSHAARMCRTRGRIVLVGVAGLELNRSEFYAKELTFQVSCSYGPGRYDPAYEELGQDYPVGFVRWTERRNFEAVLDLLAAGVLTIAPLVTHRFAVTDAPKAYDLLASGNEPYLGILLDYPENDAGADRGSTIRLASAASPPRATSEPAIGVVGAGNYASRVLIPAFKSTGAALVSIASSGGVAASQIGKRFAFAEATTDVDRLIADPRVNTVVVATRHDTHAALVCQALAAGKHVFVEKPLAIAASEVERIEQAIRSMTAPPLLMVGFNRRFAPHVLRMKALLDTSPAPKSFIITVNAGAIPPSHWTQSLTVGGGRIVGEACHFVDLLRFLAGAPVEGWQVTRMGGRSPAASPADKASITLSFADGSIGTIHYFANGHGTFPKERVEAFSEGRILQLDNFRMLRGFGWNGFSRMRLWRADKGQQECVAAFTRAVRTGSEAPIPLEQILEVSRVTLAVAAEAMR